MQSTVPRSSIGPGLGLSMGLNFWHGSFIQKDSTVLSLVEPDEFHDTSRSATVLHGFDKTQRQ
jgi:hypothetical protein